MNLRTLFLLLISALYLWGAHWFYINKINGICCGAGVSDNTTAGINSPNNKDNSSLISPPTAIGSNPLDFFWGEAEPEVNDGFEDYRIAMLEGMTDDNTLQLTADYHADEEAPEGFPTMGHARAAALRQLLKEHISEDRVIINGRLVDELDGVRENAFEAISYNWVEAVKKDETTIIEVEDQTLIFHPYNSSDRLENEKINAYLDKLAERLNETNEQVSVTGHTDWNGDHASNRRLGLYRSQGIRDLLVQRGVDRKRIKVKTQGESFPIATNTTEVGRQKNRRTEILILPSENPKEF